MVAAEDKPTIYILKQIRNGLTQYNLDQLIKDPKTPLPLFIAALQGYDRYKKIIDRLQKILNK